MPHVFLVARNVRMFPYFVAPKFNLRSNKTNRMRRKSESWWKIRRAEFVANKCKRASIRPIQLTLAIKSKIKVDCRGNLVFSSHHIHTVSFSNCMQLFFAEKTSRAQKYLQQTFVLNHASRFTNSNSHPQAHKSFYYFDFHVFALFRLLRNWIS